MADDNDKDTSVRVAVRWVYQVAVALTERERKGPEFWFKVQHEPLELQLIDGLHPGSDSNSE